eukprot:gnl/Chilomastix_cuspidata/410.p8 GENE.gnl/Chilomastix_cuspidata/410~~gnl/Chilomastix_cuspidata/410.p8  ORF type:complete len:208 (+),score=108.72 gnl/Chilomastix_cuspidata/410:4812-5435(+)
MPHAPQAETHARTVLVDMDSTMTQLIKHFKRVEERIPIPVELRKEEEEHTLYPLSRSYPPEYLPAIFEQLSCGDFFSTMEPYAPAVRAVRELLADGFHVMVCTKPLPEKRFGRGSRREKREWVARHLGADMAPQIVFEGEKWRVPGAYLIDDNPEILEEEARASWRAILVDQPYNRHLKCERRVQIPTIADDLRRIFAADEFVAAEH